MRTITDVATPDLLSVTDVIPTPDNPRFDPPQKSIASIAESIKNVGLLHPVLVRPHPSKKGKYDLRCGHRRLAAFKSLGRTEIPAVIREMTDVEAMEVTLTENLQREDLHPLEEAMVIAALLEKVGWDFEAIAAHQGKTAQWVARRAKLGNLSTKWQKAVTDTNSRISEYSAGHLEVVARFPHNIQDGWLDELDDVYTDVHTIADLESFVGDVTKLLTNVSWDVDDELLMPEAGACSKCPKRSSCEPLLWDADDVEGDGRVGKTDGCLDADCFERKMLAQARKKLADASAKHGTAIVVNTGRPLAEQDKAFGLKVLEGHQFIICKKSAPNAKPAIDLASPNRVKWITSYSGFTKRLGHAGSVKGNARDPSKPTPLKVHRAKLQKRRDAFVVDAVAKHLRKIKPADLMEIAAPPCEPVSVGSLVLAFGTHDNEKLVSFSGGGSPWKLYDQHRKVKEAEVHAAILHSVIQVWVSRLHYNDNDRITAQAAEAKRMCEITGFDFAAAQREAIEKIAEPKAWSTLKADGTPKGTKAGNGGGKGKAKTVSVKKRTVKKAAKR